MTLALTGTAFAGGLSEPMVEAEPMMAPETVAAETTSSGSFVIPLLLLAVIATVVSQSGGDSGSGVDMTDLDG